MHSCSRDDRQWQPVVDLNLQVEVPRQVVTCEREYLPKCRSELSDRLDIYHTSVPSGRRWIALNVFEECLPGLGMSGKPVVGRLDLEPRVQRLECANGQDEIRNLGFAKARCHPLSFCSCRIDFCCAVRSWFALAHATVARAIKTAIRAVNVTSGVDIPLYSRN